MTTAAAADPAVDSGDARTAAIVDRIVRRLASPGPAPGRPGAAQSLAAGAAGVALLHIERALTGPGSWQTVHTWLAAVTRDGVIAGTDAGLYLGAPAVAFVLHAAVADGADRYRRGIAAVDRAVADLVHQRVDHAHARLEDRRLPRTAEFDLIAGLTGLGVHLLHHRPGSDALGRVLTHLVRLTEPLRHEGRLLPGWWTEQDPHGAVSAAFPGGHANLGMAHGISGPLALLALAGRRRVLVEGQQAAIERVCDWLDRWRQNSAAGPWWPRWVTEQERRSGRVTQYGPGRPSWCYGTPGLARAQQLAGLACADGPRQRLAEDALARCLTDLDQLGRLNDAGLCHGWAGLLQTTRRAAGDAASPTLATLLPALTAGLAEQAAGRAGPSGAGGFLEGEAGTALALEAFPPSGDAHASVAAAPASGWDACLGIS